MFIFNTSGSRYTKYTNFRQATLEDLAQKSQSSRTLQNQNRTKSGNLGKRGRFAIRTIRALPLLACLLKFHSLLFQQSKTNIAIVASVCLRLCLLCATKRIVESKKAPLKFSSAMMRLCHEPLNFDPGPPGGKITPNIFSPNQQILQIDVVTCASAVTEMCLPSSPDHLGALEGGGGQSARGVTPKVGQMKKCC